MTTIVHKANSRSAKPLVSLVLLDWECRERFHTLDWLNRQDAPRDQYEIVWIELFNRVAPEAMERADVVITCGQKGLYHKHDGYNIGLLRARGRDHGHLRQRRHLSSRVHLIHPCRVQGVRRRQS